MNQLLQILCLIVLFVTAGCAAMPFDEASDQKRSVEIALNNLRTTQTFKVSVVNIEADQQSD